MRARSHEWQRFWTGQVFVSYARREFYFAENLVKRLEEQGAATSGPNGGPFLDRL